MTPTFSTMFNKTWLFETPAEIPGLCLDTTSTLFNAIEKYIDKGNSVINVSTTLKKMEVNDKEIFYWIDESGYIQIATKFYIERSGLYVGFTAKDPGSTVRASDFYNMILKDAGKLIFSGDTLSHQGFGIWKHLLNNGSKLFVYDTDNPLNRTSINSEAELNLYFKDSMAYKRYRFVLCESIKQQTGVKNSFNMLKTYLLAHGVDLHGNKLNV